jgi:P27 family predicted phage terminase small subunit
MRGAKPKPTQLKIISGNPGRRTLNTHEPRPTGKLGEPLAWLSPTQRQIWDRVVAEAPPGLLTACDEKTLLVYVVATDLHALAVQQIALEGVMTTAPHTGILMQSPWVAVVNRQALIILKAAAEMGLTPSARSRVAVEVAQPSRDVWADF